MAAKNNWLGCNGPEGDIVLSSRIRLARNIDDLPYPNKASNQDLAKVEEAVKSSFISQQQIQLHYIELEDLPEVERQVLVEKNLISPVHASEGKYKGVLLNDQENISIMVNEEDHIRIQVLMPGLELDKAWMKADNIDDLLEEKVDYAYGEKWGYLSACPTNVGTGLRASVMVHLPGLNITNNIGKMLEAVSQLGLVVRGIYGEGSHSSGNIYQISNQLTLGQTEEEIIDNLKSVTAQIIDQERQARSRLLQKVQVRDRIQRSYGTLKYAYQVSSEEAMKLLSNVRLGIDLGIIDSVDPCVLSELMVLIRPAHLQKIEGREIATEKRDIIRARLIQKKING